MDVHFCGGEVESVGFYGKADECEMMKEAKISKSQHACCSAKTEKKSHCQKKSSNNAVKKGNCCVNETFILQTTDDGQTTSAFNIANIDITFVTLYVFNEFFSFENETQVNDFNYYSPPKLYYDAIIQHQVFLI